MFWPVTLMGFVAALGGYAPNYTDHAWFVKTPQPIVGGKPYVIEPPDRIRSISPAAEGNTSDDLA